MCVTGGQDGCEAKGRRKKFQKEEAGGVEPKFMEVVGEGSRAKQPQMNQSEWGLEQLTAAPFVWHHLCMRTKRATGSLNK